MIKVFLLALLTFVLPSAQGKVLKSRHREMSESALAQFACGGFPALRALWAAGIFDADVGLAEIEASARRPVADSIERFLRQERNEKRFGYTQYHCGQSLRILTYPSPYSWAEFQMGEKLPCGQTSMRFQKHEGGLSQEITAWKDVPKVRGMTSVTCTDASQMMFLIPTQPEESYAPPSSSRSDLPSWIADIRTQAGLSPLKIDHELKEFAFRLISTGTLEHPTKLMDKMGKEAERDGKSLIGEARVKGANVGEQMWSLWNSPRHRDILLDPAAKSLYVAHVGVKKEGVFSLILLSRTATP